MVRPHRCVTAALVFWHLFLLHRNRLICIPTQTVTVAFPLVWIKSDTMMSQNLAAHNLYQHSDSLAMSWNASLPPRPDAVATGHANQCSLSHSLTHTHIHTSMCGSWSVHAYALDNRSITVATSSGQMNLSSCRSAELDPRAGFTGLLPADRVNVWAKATGVSSCPVPYLH